MDLIDALESLGGAAGWDVPSFGDFGMNSEHATVFISALAGEQSLFRALRGERLHVNVSPAEEETEEDDRSEPSEPDASGPERPLVQ